MLHNMLTFDTVRTFCWSFFHSSTKVRLNAGLLFAIESFDIVVLQLFLSQRICILLSSLLAMFQMLFITTSDTFYTCCSFPFLALSYFILYFRLFPISETPCNHLHNEIKPLKSFADRLGKCHIGLNGLYGEKTWKHLQPVHSTAQRFEENKCGNSEWSQAVPASPVHPATVHSQRWTQATVWKELCSRRPWQQTSIDL